MLQEAIGGAVQDDRLTLHEILADIPHDAAAFVVYAMVAFSLWLIWWANRNAARRGPAPGEEAVRDRPLETEDAGGPSAESENVGDLQPRKTLDPAPGRTPSSGRASKATRRRWRG